MHYLCGRGLGEKLNRYEPHIAPLSQLIDKMRERPLSVPDVDRNDAGVNAKILFFLETPGPQAVNGVVSRNNSDPTARNFKAMCELVGLSYSTTALWNVVPYCLSTKDRSINPTHLHIRASLGDTLEFIECFQGLRAIVFCGASAKYAMAQLDGVSVEKNRHISHRR